MNIMTNIVLEYYKSKKVAIDKIGKYFQGKSPLETMNLIDRFHNSIKTADHAGSYYDYYEKLLKDQSITDELHDDFVSRDEIIKFIEDIFRELKTVKYKL